MASPSGDSVEDPVAVGEGEATPVAATAGRLDPSDRPTGQEVEERPVGQGPAEGETHRDHPGVTGPGRRPGPSPPAESARGRGEDRADGVVELADAGEAGGEGDGGHRQVGRLDQYPGRLGPLGPGQGQGAGAELGHQQAVELPLAVAEAGGHAPDPFAVHRPVGDVAHGPGHHVGPAVPLRRPRAGVGAAAQARPKPGPLGGGGGGVEADVPALGGHGRAARPAVDAGRGHGGEEPPVEAGVARLTRPGSAARIPRPRRRRSRSDPSLAPPDGRADRRRSLAEIGHPRPGRSSAAEWVGGLPGGGGQGGGEDPGPVGGRRPPGGSPATRPAS